MHFVVSCQKTKFGIFQFLFFCEFLDKVAGFFEIVPREPREEVMGDLQVKSTMEKF